MFCGLILLNLDSNVASLDTNVPAVCASRHALLQVLGSKTPRAPSASSRRRVLRTVAWVLCGSSEQPVLGFTALDMCVCVCVPLFGSVHV